MAVQKLYKEAPIPADEKDRLLSLKNLNILDTPPEERFDRITKLALHLFNVPISTITLVDSKREWFKSCQGLPKREGERAISFCGHALLSEDLFIIPDTKKDPRFAKNPMVSGSPYIKFYAGYPLKAADGKRAGVFCIKDRKSRNLNKDQIALLKSLAAWAELELNTHELHLAISTREKAEIRVAQLNEVLQLLHKNLKHDLLNDLTVIKGLVEMYQKNKNEENLNWVLSTIDQGANSIQQMSKLESAITTGQTFQKYDLKEVTEKVASFFPTMKFNISGCGQIWADEAIFSVIENIFRNAQIHGQTKKIEIKITNGKNITKSSIADFGKGIPDEVKKKLFEPGFKYGITGHSGLGLYIIKRTIERYGGNIKITDSKPKGTTVTLQLPNNIVL